MSAGATPEPREPHTFKYERPAMDRPKTITWLAKTDRLFATVQNLKQGGENNLHAHNHLDGFWMVLSGRARFYGEGDKVLGDLGKYEGILLPRGAKYWFESSGDEPLELLQVEASDIALRTSEELKADRVDYTPRKDLGTAHTEAVAG